MADEETEIIFDQIYPEFQIQNYTGQLEACCSGSN